jgi:hypothetical protein
MIEVEFFFHHFTLKIKISYDFQIIPQLFHFYSRAKNYSRTPQNGIEILPFGDPESGKSLAPDFPG